MQSLVTGAGGFLGSAIARALVTRGNSVRGIARGNYPELRDLGIDMLRADIRDPQAVLAACRGVDVVFHTAAVAGIWGRWEHFHSINVVGTEHVITACRAQGVARLVFTSSPSVTFDGSDQVGVDESSPYPTRWLCHYPHTKALAEQAVLDAHGSDSLATCALRPHLIWGPGDQHLIPRLIARAKAGKLRRIGDGQNMIDNVYIDNAAEAHLQAADALDLAGPVGGRAYFISQGQPVNCWDWLNDILRLAGIAPVRRCISRGAAWRIGAILEMVYRMTGRQSEPPMTRFLAAQLATSHYFRIDRARRDFGYAPSVSLEDGMRQLERVLADSRHDGVGRR